MSLDRFQFKLFLCFLMLADHIDFFIPQYLAIFFKIISRCVAVGFAYLAVEAFIHTSNIKSYLIRLYGFSIFMLIGNHILNYIFMPHVVIKNSIMMTLSLGISMLVAYTKINNTFFKIISILSIMYFSLYFEGGIFILPYMLISYIFRHDEKKRNIIFLLAAVYLFLSTLIYAVKIHQPILILKYSEYLFISIIPLLKIYNGKKGKQNSFSKYFFYVFYPLHLWIIAFIEYLIKIDFIF